MKVLLAGLAVLVASTAAGAVVAQDLFRGRAGRSSRWRTTRPTTAP
jgi:hypothetical protein